jgi:hypothetical protein
MRLPSMMQILIVGYLCGPLRGFECLPIFPRSVGLSHIRMSIELIFENIVFEDFNINPEEVHILGDQAYSHGLFCTSMTPKTGGETIEVRGKFLTILTK